MRRLLALLLLALVLTLALPAVAYAADFYVATGGNDANDGLSAGTAFLTIQHAVDVAAIAAGAPHNVHVGAGTFTGDLFINGNISLHGAGSGATVLQGTGATSVVSAVGMTATISGFTITGGSANTGGGVFVLGSVLTITDCTITGNTAGRGGGIGAISTTVTVYNTTIAGNVASASGGGVYCEIATPTITGNTITGNSAADGGGIRIVWATGAVIQNNVIAANSAQTGGGISVSGSAAIANDTLVDNTATLGSAAAWEFGMIRNCVVRGASPLLIGLDAMYSNVQGGAAGTGNTDTDPLFVNAAAGDFRLQVGSPCIDAGTGTGAPATDIRGVARPQGAGVDMGAYEFFGQSVTFDSQGGSAVAAEVVDLGSLVTRPTDPTRAGFTFGGWCTEAACTHVWDFAADTVTDPITLYAKWTPLPITGMNAAYTMYAGDSLTIDAKPDGGTWNWDAAYFSATFNSPATFTALRTGSSVVTYAANGVTASATITVLARPVSAVTSARTLPATGANIARTMLAALLAACAGAALRIGSRRA